MSEEITYAKGRRNTRRLLSPLPWLSSLKYLKYLIGIAGFGLLLLSATTFGLPHVLYAYDYRLWGSERHYTACRYYGPYGAFERTALDGTCPYIRLFQPRTSFQ